MGAEKTTVNTQSQATATPMEKQRNQLYYNQEQQLMPYQTQADINALNNTNTLLTGGQLPGNLGALSQGLNPNVQNSMVQSSLRQLYPQFAGQGILDSGTAAMAGARTAGDIYQQSAQFNISNLMNLLSAGMGGQVQSQQPIMGYSSQLGSSLAGLRSVSGSQTTSAMNPFLKSFEQGSGTALSNWYNPQTYIKK